MTDRPLSLEAILMLSEDEIAETFPHGIVAVAKDRWRPAVEGEEAHKELGELVKAKHDRQEQPRYLRQSYSVPSKYVRNPNAKSREDENDNYTHLSHKAVQGAQGAEMAVPEEYQKRITVEARLRDAERLPALHERLRRLEEHAQPHQLESLKRRIEGLERSLHDKAA